MKHHVLFALALSSLAGGAQAQRPAAAPAAAPDAAVRTMRELWQNVTNYLNQAAADVPESLYSYRPTTTVRTFGEQIAHVAGAQYMFCAAVLGDPPRDEAEIEKSKTTKAELVAAMRASTDYCGRAYALSDAAAQQGMQLFGSERTKLYALGQNALHNGEHYGNIVTYMRTNGLVPPSSRR